MPKMAAIIMQIARHELRHDARIVGQRDGQRQARHRQWDEPGTDVRQW